MTIGPFLIERRRYPRFRLNAGAYVVNAARPGMITDISMSGLSWRYVDRKQWGDSPPTLDILLEEHGPFVADLPYRVISDCEAEHDCPDHSLAVRRRSVQFGELTDDQRARLEELIRQNAAAPLQQAAVPN